MQKVIDTENLQRFQANYENSKRQAGQSHLNTATASYIEDLKRRMDQTFASAARHHPPASSATVPQTPTSQDSRSQRVFDLDRNGADMQLDLMEDLTVGLGPLPPIATTTTTTTSMGLQSMVVDLEDTNFIDSLTDSALSPGLCQSLQLIADLTQEALYRHQRRPTWT